jgi:hypothetical protein
MKTILQLDTRPSATDLPRELDNRCTFILVRDMGCYLTRGHHRLRQWPRIGIGV